MSNVILQAATALFIAGAAIVPSIAIAAPKLAAKAAPELVIYHMEGARSERIVWLAEELGLPYRLVFTRGDLAASMASIKAVNPGMPVAPTVSYNGQILVESAGIIETLIARYGDGRLAPKVESPDFPLYKQWIHFAEGSFAPSVGAEYRAARAADGKRPKDSRTQRAIKFMEAHLAKHPYFGGAEFSGADIMSLFMLDLNNRFGLVDLSKYPAVTAWMARVKERPAYKRAMAAAVPNGPVLPFPKLTD